MKVDLDLKLDLSSPQNNFLICDVECTIQPDHNLMLNQKIYFWPFWPLIMTYGHSIMRNMPDPESTHVTDQNEGWHGHIILNWKMSSIWGHPIFDSYWTEQSDPVYFTPEFT